MPSPGRPKVAHFTNSTAFDHQVGERARAESAALRTALAGRAEVEAGVGAEAEAARAAAAAAAEQQAAAEASRAAALEAEAEAARARGGSLGSARRVSSAWACSQHGQSPVFGRAELAKPAFSLGHLWLWAALRSQEEPLSYSACPERRRCRRQAVPKSLIM